MKIQTAFLTEIDMPILKFEWKCKGLKIVLQFWKRRKELEDLTPQCQNLQRYDNQDNVVLF